MFVQVLHGRKFFLRASEFLIVAPRDQPSPPLNATASDTQSPSIIGRQALHGAMSGLGVIPTIASDRFHSRLLAPMICESGTSTANSKPFSPNETRDAPANAAEINCVPNP